MIGLSVSHYTILQRIGGGGMGVVYKAEDTRLQRTVALKLLPPDVTGDPNAKARLLREARAASAIQHQNICTVHEIGETEDGQVFICMDYYEGETLKDRLSRLRAADSHLMPLSDLLDVAIQTAQGLAKAHEKGIIHRDIKPANIIIASDNVVKLLDFGLARFAGKSGLTRTGNTAGTIAYLSPEQAAGGHVDHRTDIWSLGVVLYEMCTGRLPFEHDVDAAVIYAILDKTPVTPSARGADIPEALEKVIFKCLEKNPDDRYQSAQELLDDLNDIWKSSIPDAQATALRKGRLLYEATGTTWKRRLTNKWTILAGGALAVLVVCFLFVLPQMRQKNASLHSIAVLPLENLTNDKEQDYFVSGIHEELLTDLAKIKALKVISKTSMMRYENTKKSAPEIAEELNVETLVEGSVLRVNDHVRINVQLIDGLTDRHLWAESYDRDVQDVLTMLSEVARAITREIAVNVTQEEVRQFDASHPVNRDAHDEYFKGQYLFHYFTLARCQEALKHFEKAAQIDPSFAPGYAGQAYVYFVMGLFGMKPYPEVIPKARTMAMRALELDEGLGEAHSIMSWIKFSNDWDWPGALKELQRALDLNPGDVIARHVYADYLTVMGHVEDGVHQVDLAREYDPLSPIAVMPSVYHHFFVHRYDEVIEECRKLLLMESNYPIARSTLRDALWMKGSYEEAFVEYQKTWGQNPELRVALDRGYRRVGPKGAVRELASTYSKQAQPYTGSFLKVAILYAVIDEKDSAFVWLEKAYEDRSPFLVELAASPLFDSLRPDPRFRALLNRIGFPDVEQRSTHDER